MHLPYLTFCSFDEIIGTTKIPSSYLDLTAISENANINKSYSTSVHDFRHSYLQLNRNELIDIAHQPKDMIKGCIYLKRIRQKHPFCTDLIDNGGTKIFTPTYGVCYMFNFKGINKTVPPLTSYQPGEEYGLQLTVNIESKLFKNE